MNEAIRGGVVGQAFHFLGFAQADGVVHLRLIACEALGLELVELAQGVFHGAVQPLFVDAEVDEVLGVK